MKTKILFALLFVLSFSYAQRGGVQQPGQVAGKNV
jgi:hypothetical protein